MPLTPKEPASSTPARIASATYRDVTTAAHEDRRSIAQEIDYLLHLGLQTRQAHLDAIAKLTPPAT